jgi:hypothetical protein
MTPHPRRSPGTKSRATSTTATVDSPRVTAEADELLEELRRIKTENGDLFTALLNGVYRLAVPCRVCSRALTSSKSRAAGVGPICAKAVR